CGQFELKPGTWNAQYDIKEGSHTQTERFQFEAGTERERTGYDDVQSAIRRLGVVFPRPANVSAWAGGMDRLLHGNGGAKAMTAPVAALHYSAVRAELEGLPRKGIRPVVLVTGP